MADMIRTVLVEQKMIYEERIAQLIKERDLARREVCRHRAANIQGKQPEEIAVDLGWDCFTSCSDFWA